MHRAMAAGIGMAVMVEGLTGCSDGGSRPSASDAEHSERDPQGFVEWVAAGADVCPGSNANIGGDVPPEGGLHDAHSSESGITEHLEVPAGVAETFVDYGIGAV